MSACVRLISSLGDEETTGTVAQGAQQAHGFKSACTPAGPREKRLKTEPRSSDHRNDNNKPTSTPCMSNLTSKK